MLWNEWVSIWWSKPEFTSPNGSDKGILSLTGTQPEAMFTVGVKVTTWGCRNHHGHSRKDPWMRRKSKTQNHPSLCLHQRKVDLAACFQPIRLECKPEYHSRKNLRCQAGKLRQICRNLNKAA